MSVTCWASWTRPVAPRQLPRRVPTPCSKQIPPNTKPVCSQTYTFPPLLRTVERLTSCYACSRIEPREIRGRRQMHYVLRVQGHLDLSLSDRFGGLRIEQQEAGTTLLS